MKMTEQQRLNILAVWPNATQIMAKKVGSSFSSCLLLWTDKEGERWKLGTIEGETFDLEEGEIRSILEPIPEPVKTLMTMEQVMAIPADAWFAHYVENDRLLPQKITTITEECVFIGSETKGVEYDKVRYTLDQGKTWKDLYIYE